MKLKPKRPAGRPNRKALAFEAEIARLRSEGFPCQAIWEALLDAGVALSLSAVKLQPSAFQTRVCSPAGTSSSPSGKDVAAAWMTDHISNPLLQARIAHESGRH